MKKKFCVRCDKETWHNPLKAKKTEPTDFRCTSCGFPIRTGGNAKNFGVRVGLKIKFFGPGEKIA